MIPTGFREFSGLVDRLYGAALRPDDWPAALAGAAAMFGANHAFVSRMADGRRPFAYTGLPRSARATHPVTSYERVIAEDPRQHVFNHALGRVTHCRMGLSDERIRTSRAYRDYLEPLDLEYTMLLVLPVRENLTHTFGVNRGRGDRPFNAADCDLMTELAPHITRAFEIQRCIEASGLSLPEARLPETRRAAAVPPEAVGMASRLSLLFGLPPAQARLTQLLLEGHTVTEAAGILGITVGSARQYLRGVFLATGARRQADLIRLAYDALGRQTREAEAGAAATPAHRSGRVR